MPESARSDVRMYVPLIGIVLFLMLYVYATTLYPGGNQNNLEAIGFDWIHNYWCNLLNQQGMNGMNNPARPIAITGLGVLCLSLATFFSNFGKMMVKGGIWKLIIPVFGIMAMGSTVFIYTDYHDILTIVSSIFGFFSVLGIIITIYKSNLLSFKVGGLVCLLLLLANNVIYYSKIGIVFLPSLQKITFLAVIIWVFGLSLFILNKNRATIINGK